MSVTAAGGWKASGVVAGTKSAGGLDLALMVSDVPAAVAGAFTTNKAPCAHIQLCVPRVAAGVSRGVLVSAGIANAATGADGLRDAESLAQAAADGTGCPPEQMLFCATGVIGPRIPVDRVRPAVRAAVAGLSPEGGDTAARSIMTTDTRPKQALLRTEGVTVGGMAKGAGMIAPRMDVPHATMLAFVTTDAVADASVLRHSLSAALPPTFNSISVDGGCSTNDTVLLFANGTSGVRLADEVLSEAVREVMARLAYEIVSDGEGATKVIRVAVTEAVSQEDARRCARSICDSLLFRAAVWGGDANWGRVVQAVGQSGAEFDPGRVSVSIGGVELAREGTATHDVVPVPAGEVPVEVRLGLGDSSWEMLTCDLSPEYVRLNADPLVPTEAP
ncbi:MAG TPA: bifunctional glutamate N-acetyltransferase/amino-acid acetyltransferase ArgJ [Actinomycetota bacterium]|nr:bifunctional glutamate N-acetyltransferase/amino-acid acetyltransferase ArgJ [Actinomycetota bacterium]